MPKKGNEFIFYSLSQMDQSSWPEDLEYSEHPYLARGEEHNDVLQGESDESQPLDDFWSISGNHNCRHHVQHRAKLHVPKEGSFPFPLMYVDVAMRTNATMDVLLEGRIERQLER